MIFCRTHGARYLAIYICFVRYALHAPPRFPCHAYRNGEVSQRLISEEYALGQLRRSF